VAEGSRTLAQSFTQARSFSLVVVADTVLSSHVSGYDELIDSSIVMEILVADVEADYTRNLGRNLVIGLISAYAGTVGMVYAALRELDVSAAIAIVPSLFAGPYVGIMLTLVGANKAESEPVSSVQAATPGPSS
jgi:hypothetical protein